MGLIDLLYVQILARGNSGATGMESKTQYNNIILYDATQKGGFVCVRVFDRAVLRSECARVCVCS